MSRPAVEDERLFAEVLAYGLSLIELRLTSWPAADRAACLCDVRHYCATWQAGRKWRWKGPLHRLGTPPHDPNGQRSLTLFQATQEQGSLLTKEVYAEFCRATGLSSKALVGRGENLASLIFYFVVYAVISAEAPLSRAQALTLLKAAQRCRSQLEEFWNKQSPEPGPPLLSAQRATAEEATF